MIKIQFYMINFENITTLMERFYIPVVIEILDNVKITHRNTKTNTDFKYLFLCGFNRFITH